MGYTISILAEAFELHLTLEMGAVFKARYAHRKTAIVATVDKVRLVFENKLIARHDRHWGANSSSSTRCAIWRSWNAIRADSITRGRWNTGPFPIASTRCGADKRTNLGSPRCIRDTERGQRIEYRIEMLERLIESYQTNRLHERPADSRSGLLLVESHDVGSTAAIDWRTACRRTANHA